LPWNDLVLKCDVSGNYQPKGYIVEYGGLPGETPFKPQQVQKMTMITIVGSTGNSICGPGSTTLQATARMGGHSSLVTDSATNGNFY
jgi:hypothetical protein